MAVFRALFALALYIRRSTVPKLVLCLLVDMIGFASFLLPGIGEFGDVIWAPISAAYLFFMFDQGLRVMAIGFFEELMPGLDFVPTATLAWAAEHVDIRSLDLVRTVLGVPLRRPPD